MKLLSRKKKEKQEEEPGNARGSKNGTAGEGGVRKKLHLAIA